MDPDLERRRPEEEGVGVVGRWPDGEISPENVVAEELRVDEDDEWSMVLGTWTHMFIPIASFIFLHLLPILVQKGQQNHVQILKQWTTHRENSELNAWKFVSVSMVLSIEIKEKIKWRSKRERGWSFVFVSKNGSVMEIGWRMKGEEKSGHWLEATTLVGLLRIKRDHSNHKIIANATNQ